MSANERAQLTWVGKCERRSAAGSYKLVETFEPFGVGGRSDQAAGPPGALYLDDNRRALAHLASEIAGQVRLVYLDPPYLSGSAYGREVVLRGSGRPAGRLAEFDDRLDEPSYLQMLFECLLAVRDLLAPDGSVWLHCDFRQSHHIRCLLDEVFGAEAFRNEVVWAYGSTARGAKAIGRQLPRNHDVLFWYAGPRARYRPLVAERVMTLGEAARAGYQVDGAGRAFRTAPRGDYTDASLGRLAEEGRVHLSQSGRSRVKYFARREGDSVVEDRLLGDVWSDVPDAMHLAADERTGYPTQKPERLLERVVLASTDPGDLVLDPFAGSGTTLAIAQRLRRRWIGVDAATGAIQASRRRMIGQIGRPNPPAPFPEGKGGPGLGAERSEGCPLPLGESQGEGAPSPSFRIYEPIGAKERVPSGSSARLRVAVTGADEQSLLVVEVESYRSPELSARLGADPDWREALDCVLIDPDYDGHVFRARLADAPAGRRRGVTGRYELPLSESSKSVAVRLVDVLGDETLVLPTLQAGPESAS